MITCDSVHDKMSCEWSVAEPTQKLFTWGPISLCNKKAPISDTSPTSYGEKGLRMGPHLLGERILWSSLWIPAVREQLQNHAREFITIAVREDTARGLSK